MLIGINRVGRKSNQIKLSDKRDSIMYDGWTCNGTNLLAVHSNYNQELKIYVNREEKLQDNVESTFLSVSPLSRIDSEQDESDNECE